MWQSKNSEVFHCTLNNLKTSHVIGIILLISKLGLTDFFADHKGTIGKFFQHALKVVMGEQNEAPSNKVDLSYSSLC